MFRLLYIVVVANFLPGCSQQADHPTTAASDTSTRVKSVENPGRPAIGLTKLPSVHLPNAVQIHPRVISGGLPDGAAGFAELKSLGVRTIISVDGAKPDVELASAYGLRYVHLPHGYDGIPDQRVKELAKAVRDLEAPIYIHCHHGKHRSPAAAAVACVTAGLIEPSRALAVLKLAGTNPNYRGLYESASDAVPLEKALLDELQIEFRDTVDVRPMAEAMVALERTHDHLNTISAADWRVPRDHPDLEPIHEALLLREHFRELLRTQDVQQQPDAFQELLRDAEQAALELEQELIAWNPTSRHSAPPESLDRIANQITANCKACHQKFRDIPLSEK